MHKILYALPFNIEYTGLGKALLDSAYDSSNIAFLRPVYSILDAKAYNIHISWSYLKQNPCSVLWVNLLVRISVKSIYFKGTENDKTKYRVIGKVKKKYSTYW